MMVVYVALLLVVVIDGVNCSSREDNSLQHLVTTAHNKCSKQCGAAFKCQTRPCTCQICVPLTCADIYCAAGFMCALGPDGPDCVPDTPTCEGFFCARGTNCYIRDGAPVCLPNTCEVRVCEAKLTCIDTPNGALCRRGKKRQSCENKYCPRNSRCEDSETSGAVCKKI